MASWKPTSCETSTSGGTGQSGGYATVAAYSVSHSSMAILWGIAFGVLANYGAEWLSKTITVHGHGFVDPPASMIFVATVLVWLLKQVNAFQDQFLIPSAILLAGIAYAIYVAVADKDLAATVEQSVMEEQGLDKIEPEPIR